MPESPEASSAPEAPEAPEAPGSPEDVVSADPVESAETPAFGDPRAGAYRPPMVVAVGSVRRATKGSAASGKADANSQFYW
ncbi:lasso RiPP family leader peptide-containing protein [Embleya sp. NPDC055664]